MIRVTDHIALDESELDESFIRASGPGGQNVNKLSTADAVCASTCAARPLAHRRWCARGSSALAGKRLTDAR